MKKYLFFVLAIVICAGCGGKKSLKIDDPEVRASMRTRDTSCPYDSVLTAKGLKITLDVFSQIKPKQFIVDYKEAKAAAVETKPVAKVKEAYAAVKEKHSEEYSPGLTIYFSIVLIAFIIIVLIKVFRALFSNS